MDTISNAALPLTDIRANRQMVDALASGGCLSPQAREFALGMLYPSQQWALWISRLLLTLGASLVLSGIIYFFAFNWARISPVAKLGSLEAMIAFCLMGSFFYGLERISGKMLLLCASVVLGVFLAVFGQIYQTGADAYSLFLTWSALILPWVILCRFAALWAVWLMVSNTAIILCWQQAVLPSHQVEMMILPLMALFNAVFLALREIGAERGLEWLSERWTREILVLPVLTCAAIPIIWLIIEDYDRVTYSIRWGALTGLALHAGLYLYYRYRRVDMWALATIVLSACIIVEAMFFHLLVDRILHVEAFTLLLLGGITIAIFTSAIVYLRRVAKSAEGGHE